VPAYNTDLIPTGVVSDIIESASAESVALRLGRVIQMPAGVMSVPVVSVAPTAEWVALGARKPIAEIDWSAERLEPEEIACVTFIPDAYISDSGFPIWESVQGELTKAVARVLDAAVLFGTNAPPSFPDDGVAGADAPQITDTDALTALSDGMAAIEAQGLTPDGIASSPVIGGAMRQAWQNVAALPDAAPGQLLWGIPVATTSAWDASKGDAIVGSWQYLVIGIRQDVTFATSDSATLVDDEGAIQVSAFQDDVTVLRIVMRVAAAIGRPVGPDGPVEPFSAVSWT
jgi:hypothetical protein